MGKERGEDGEIGKEGVWIRERNIVVGGRVEEEYRERVRGAGDGRREE